MNSRRLPIPLLLFGSSGTLVLALVGCDANAGEVGVGSPMEPPSAAFAGIRQIASPASAGSVTPYLSDGRDGRIYLSWQEPDGMGHAFRIARLDGSGWSEPQTIARGDDFFVNWADFPSIVELPDGSLAAHWLQRNGPGTYAYGVRIGRSADGGKSWSEPITPHLDATQTEHGFVSLFPAAEGRLAAVWLDGRDFAHLERGEIEERETGPPDADMSLRYAEITGTGEIGSETLLDEQTCDCCQTSVALTSAGPLVAYRDRSRAEIRDISVVRLVNGAWTEPASLHDDEWHIPACPVNGPAAAASGDRVVVAWYTAAGDEPKVLASWSEDAGESFRPPLRLDDGRPLGRVDTALLGDGSALVLWLETSDEGARVLVRRVLKDGSMTAAQTAARSDGSRSSGFPRMAVRGDEVVLAWTDASDEGGVRTSIATLPSK